MALRATEGHEFNIPKNLLLIQENTPKEVGFRRLIVVVIKASISEHLSCTQLSPLHTIP